jgi:NADH-quinone oxidoreductase subunit E
MLSQESRQQIDREIAKYPAEQKQSAVMAALAIVQMEQGWLSTEAIELSGGVHAADYLKQKLGVGFNETTPDGRFTLKEGECMGACGDAPVMLVNNVRMCSFMQPEQIDSLLGECK